MKSKLIYILWLTTFVGVVGCVMWPSSATAEKASAAAAPDASAGPATRREISGPPYCGVAIQIQRTDWIDKYKTSIDEIAAAGADTVSLVLDTRTENIKSNRIWLDMRTTPTPEKLGELIDHAKERGLRVMLVPIVLLDDPGDDWRGEIAPEKWHDWWDSYRQMLLHFAWIAEDHKADILCVGSELVSTQEKVQDWRRTINQVRQVFHGKLTYSANWDAYYDIPFWDQLDFIGMNSYWKLGEDRRVGVEEIKKNWRRGGKYPDIEKVVEFSRRKGKPILFTEVGWCSLGNAASEPWDYTKTSEPLDLELQKRLYQAFFETWYGNPNLGGFMIWEWPPEAGGPSDKGYIPRGKPAEAVMKEWFAKPRWEVQGR